MLSEIAPHPFPTTFAPPPPDICFGWGYATVTLSTKKIKGLHENDFIMASKINQIFDRSGQPVDRQQ